MKNLSIQFVTWLFVFSFTGFSAMAQQQFRWVTGGGTNENLTSEPLATEGTQYMCTDANGNVYAVSQVGNNAVYADTFVRSTGAYGSDFNVLITSYNCNGQMRWAKLIGSPNECIAYGIAADNLGHIYVAGFFTNETLHIGYDTAIASLADEDEGLIQFDTGGHFKWIRYVGDNTLATALGSYAVGSVLAIDVNNNAHFFNYMKHGVQITPTETSIGGIYDLVYSSSGTLLSANRLDLDSQWYFNSAVIDPATNKLYATGQNGGGLVTDSFFAAAFDTGRHLIWQYFANAAGALTGVILDQSKHLYFSGGADPTAFYFNGDSIFATGFFDISVLMKTDTNGHPEWIKHYDSRSAVNGFNGVTLLPNNMVAAVGTFVESVTNGVDSLTTRPGYYWSPFIVVVDSGGNLQTMQQAYGDGFQNEGLVITSDQVGNIYFGGEVTDSIFGGTIPAYHTVGGNTDFFVTKYGVDCSCSSEPTAAYIDTGTHHTIGVTYTGTTAGLDSVVWKFGDGSSATGTTAIHTYTATGTYDVCVTTYTDCGIDEHCGSFTVTPDTPSLVGSIVTANIRVFPNPANNQVNVSGLIESTNYRLLSVTGTCVLQGSLQQPYGNISMQDIVPGVYVLELTGMDGERDIVRVVKE